MKEPRWAPADTWEQRQFKPSTWAELEELDKKRAAMPFKVEEIDALYNILTAPAFLSRALRTAVGMLLLTLLARAFAARGPEGVAACALMPIVCTMEGLLDVMDQVP